MENPWNIDSIYELQFYNCPCCVFKDHSKQTFINHAIKHHPEAVDSLTNVKDDSLSDVVIDIPANINYVEIKTTERESVVEIDSDNDEKENDSEPENNAFQCQRCNIAYSNVRELIKHIQTNHKVENANKTFTCELCDKIFQKEWKLKAHIKCAHKNKKIYQCQKCNYKTVSLIIMKIHECVTSDSEKSTEIVKGSKLEPVVEIETENDSKLEQASESFKCNICNEIHSNMEELKKHIWKNHQKETPKAKCEFCGNYFTRLEDHISRVHADIKGKDFIYFMPHQDSMARYNKHNKNM